jgi:hypothetical protein
MKINCKIIKSGILTVMLICFLIGSIIAQAFIHPGINQNSNDLARMKQLVLAAQNPGNQHSIE